MKRGGTDLPHPDLPAGEVAGRARAGGGRERAGAVCDGARVERREERVGVELCEWEVEGEVAVEIRLEWAELAGWEGEGEIARRFRRNAWEQELEKTVSAVRMEEKRKEMREGRWEIAKNRTHTAVEGCCHGMGALVVR